MRLPLLALLANGPAHGYELKQAMEQQFGSVLPPLNAGRSTRRSRAWSATGWWTTTRSRRTGGRTSASTS